MAQCNTTCLANMNARSEETEENYFLLPATMAQSAVSLCFTLYIYTPLG